MANLVLVYVHKKSFCPLFPFAIVGFSSVSKFQNFTRLDRRNQQIIRKALEDRGRYGHHSAPANKTKDFYRQCLQRNNANLADSKRKLDEIFRSINFKIGSDSPHTDLARLLGVLFRDFGVQPFFALKIGISDRDSGEHVVKVDEPTLSLGARHLYASGDDTRPALLVAYMKGLFGLIDNDGNITEEYFENITEIEFKIALDEEKPSKLRNNFHSNYIKYNYELLLCH